MIEPEKLNENEFRILMLEQLCVAQIKRIEALEKASGISHTADIPKHIVEQAAANGHTSLYKGVPVPIWGTNPQVVSWRDRILKFLHSFKP